MCVCVCVCVCVYVCVCVCVCVYVCDYLPLSPPQTHRRRHGCVFSRSRKLGMIN